MFTLNSNITITDPTGTNFLEFPFVIECKVKKSRRTLTNSATITLPRNLRVLNGDINSIIQRGGQVTAQVGYDGNLSTRFTGFVSNVNAQIPLTIECQDRMWSLKQNSFTHTFPKGVKVAEIVSLIYTGVTQVVDLAIGGMVIVKQSTAQVLDGLKKFGLQCYFDNDILIVDFAGVVHTHGKEVIYDFYQNIIENKLEYKLKEDARIKVVAISKLSNGKKIQLISGDNDGEIHTLHACNMDAVNLQKMVDAEIGKLKFDGYKGSFITFGIPEIEPGDIAIMQDSRYPEHDGSYLCESVEITWGVNGYRHEAVLERKLA